MCARPSRTVEYCGRQSSSALAFALDNGIVIVVVRVMYGTMSLGSQAGTWSGVTDPVYSAIAVTIFVMTP